MKGLAIVPLDDFLTHKLSDLNFLKMKLSFYNMYIVEARICMPELLVQLLICKEQHVLSAVESGAVSYCSSIIVIHSS